MSTIPIHVSDAMQTYVKDQAARRGYKDASEFISNLITADQHRQLRQEVEEQLLEAADGPFSDWTDDDVESIRAAGRRIIERRRVR